MKLPSSTYFKLPSRRDWIAAALIALLGGLLGLAINWASPRGFNMRTAAASTMDTP